MTEGTSPTYRRVLLKLSGEALMGQHGYGIDHTVVRSVATEVKDAQSLGAEIGIVIGGGNIFRGIRASDLGIDRVSGDHIGMLATVMNSLARGPGVVCADIELGRLNSARRNFPSIEHRRLKCLNDA